MEPHAVKLCCPTTQQVVYLTAFSIADIRQQRTFFPDIDLKHSWLIPIFLGRNV
jgi:hypothetical protein